MTQTRERNPPDWRLIALGAAAIFALSMGTRTSLSLFIGDINSSTGLGIVAISLAFGVGQLAWGVAQAAAGAVGDRYGMGKVMAAGAALMALGMAMLPYASSQWGLILAIGVLGSVGSGALGASVLMASVSRLVEPARRAMATAIVGAGGSFGQFAIVPLAQLMIGSLGWVSALWGLSALCLVALPLVYPLRSQEEPAHRTAEPDGGLAQAVGRALRDPSYLLLSAGFFTCGFHVAFIATHLPGVVASCGLPPSVGAWSLAVVGLFNIVGSFGIGWAMGRWRLKSLLSLIYAIRGVAVLLFVLAPKTELTFVLFAAIIGLTYLSTVPATGGLVARFYGPRYMATLFGLAMLTHQVGGFLGAWLGGKAVEATGGYDWIWYADIVLAFAAALIHLPIREAPLPAARAA
jgi:predicted MFS family arabinose efflux permease